MPSIIKTIKGMCDGVPPAKHTFTILENHDVSRFSSTVGEVPGKERVGAALLFTLPGVPTLYYGQEIGMLAFVRTHAEQTVLVAANLSAETQRVRLDLTQVDVSTTTGASLLGDTLDPTVPVDMAPYAVSVTALKLR